MKIIFTKEVVFKDLTGSVVREYKVGDTCKYTAKTETYFVTSLGGIFFDEAIQVED